MVTLILAEEGDVHAQAVLKTLEIECNHQAVLWNFKQFPSQPSALQLNDDGVSSFTLGDINLHDVGSVWWRRPRRFLLSERIQNTHAANFCQAECKAFVHGALNGSGIPIVNDPGAQAIADDKPHQLQTARQVGLRIPDTLISNDPMAIEPFWQACQRKGFDVVYKTLTPFPNFIYETRRLDMEGLAKLRSLVHAPVIFQAEVPRAYELRVSVFGTRVYAAKLEPQSELADVDWRMDKGSDWQPYDLPPRVAESVLRLLRSLRLDYGMVDMRVTPAGEYVFFEVNPSGQFVFIEIETGLPVCRAMADLLIDRAEAAGRLTRPRSHLSRPNSGSNKVSLTASTS